MNFMKKYKIIITENDFYLLLFKLKLKQLQKYNLGK